MLISLFKSSQKGVRNPIPEEDLTFTDYIQGIREGYWYNEVLAYRQEKSEEKKRQLPAVTPSGQFKKQGKEGLVEHSGVICIDIDAKDNEGINMRNLLTDEYLLAMHLSTGGEGYAAYFKVDPNKHLDAFLALEKRLADKYHIIIDPACKDVSRLRFVSFDTEAYLATKPIPVFKSYLPKSKSAPIMKVYPHGEHDIEFIMAQIESKRIDLTDSYADWIKIGFAIASKYKEAGYDLFHRISQISSKYKPEQCEKKYKQLCQSTHNSVTFASFMYLAKNAGVDIQTKETKHIVATAKAHKLRVGTNGGPKDINSATDSALRILKEIDQVEVDQLDQIVADTMQLDVKDLKPVAEDTPVKQIKSFLRSYNLRFNSVTRNVELDGSPITDQDINNIYLDCLESFGKKEVSMQLIQAIIDSHFVIQYNPFLEFFSANQSRHAEGHLEALARCVRSGSQTQEFVELMVRKWVCSVVASMHGEYSVIILVLCGNQGIGKTNFFRNLLPASLRSYYGESKLDAGKDDEILMCKKIILCDDEFGGKSKQEAKKLKELSSKQTFSIRKPYGRVHEDLNRYAVLCGTSNDEEVINDPTGNRRILPISVSDIDWEAYNEIDKDLLFIEALNEYRVKGADSWQLSRADIGYLDQLTYNNVQPAAEKELFLKFFYIPETFLESSGEWMTNTEIKDYIETRTKQHISSHKLGAILKTMGAKKHNRREKGFCGCYFVVRYDYAEKHPYQVDTQIAPF